MSKAICLFLAAVMLFSLTACTQARAVLTYEGNTLSAQQYAFALAERKGQFLEYYTQYSTADISSDTEFWNTATENGTLADAHEKATLDYCKTMLVVNKFCDEYKLYITDATVISDIDTMMEKITTESGGEDLLAIRLLDYGITKAELREYYENYERNLLLRKYWYGDGGTMSIPDSKVNEKFLSEYKNIDFMYFSYFDKVDNTSVAHYLADITDAEARTYFNEQYVKVQHILYSTADTSGKALSAEEVTKAEEKATAAFNAIVAKEATFEQKSADNEDSNTEYVFTHKEMAEEFETASFEMAVGDVRLVKTIYGYHIIQKLATVDEDFTKKEDAVKTAVSKARTVESANTMLANLQAGTAEFVAGSEDADYKFTADVIFTTGQVDEEIEKTIAAMAVGEYKLYDVGDSYGYYILKKNEISIDDITEYFDAVEDSLISEAFYDYLETYFPSITIDNEEIAKFDIVTTVSFPFYSYTE